ncbi:MAG: HYR domain-containing protein, partial [Draconibacterium sp.]|nr:HYR domain-containing protein [Draconibacterium sp.]
AVPLTGSPAGVVFDITGGTSIGLADQTGLTEIPSFNPIAGNATITITPRANGCTGTPVDVDIIVWPTPTVTAPIGVIFCNGELTAEYALTGTPANVVFDITGGATIGLADVTGVTGIPPFNAIEGIATVTVTPKVGGCVGTPVDFDITVLPTPTATISGSDTVCRGSLAPNIIFTNPHDIIVKAYYDINGAGSNSVNIPANSTATISVPTNNSGDYDYNLISAEYFVEPFCVNTTISGTATIVVVEPPIPTVTGPTEMCAGTAGNIYKTEHSMSNYIWSVSSGGTITAGGTATDSTITVTWNSAGTQNIGIRYDDSNSCSSASATVYPVTVDPLPVPTITGAVSACEGETDVVYTSQTGMTNYIWNVSAGGTITAGGTATDNTVTVTWNTAGAQTVSVNYTNANGCTAGSATVNNVTINPTPTPTLSGVNTACSGSTGHVYTTEAGMTNYVWTVSAGGNITAGGTINDNTATVTWNAAGAQTISVNYENGSGCSGQTPAINNVSIDQSPDPTITGAGTTCAGSEITYTSETGMTNYVWVVSAGGTTTAGGTNSDDFVTVLWNNTGNETVSVDYQNGTGCNAPAPTVKNVTVDPEVVPTIAGINSVCNGESQVYTTQTGMSNYIWTVVGGTITSGGGTGDHTATVTWNTDGTQTVSVNYLNNTGCTSVTSDNDVTVNPLPTPTITGDISVCLDGNAVHYTSEAGMTDYQWIVSAGGTITAGGTLTDDYADVTWNTTGNKTLTLNYTNSSGCRAVSATVLDITVYDLPVVACPADFVVCVNTAAFALSGGTPAGGVYSGVGVSSGNFDPGLANIGTHTITYTYTDANSCPNSCTFEIAVDPVPSASTQTYTICSGDSANIDLRSIIPDATFTWTAVLQSGAAITGFSNCSGSCDTIITNVLVNPTHTIPGGSSGSNGTVRYSVTPTANGCTGSPFNIDVTVLPAPPTLNISWNSNLDQDVIEVCAGGSALNDNDLDIIPRPNNGIYAGWNPTWQYALTPNGPWMQAPGVWSPQGYYQWLVASSLNNQIGDYYFRFRITNSNGCSSYSDIDELHIISSMTVEAGGPDFLCTSATPNYFTLSGAFVGGVSATGGNWTANVGGGNFTQNFSNPGLALYRPPANYVGEIILTLTTNDPDGSGVCVPLTDTRTLTLLEPTSFYGCVDPTTWTLSGTNSDGYLDDNSAPCFVTLVGSDNGSGSAGTTDIVHCSGAGNFSFDWSLSSPENKIVWHSENQQSGYVSGSNMIVNKPTNLVAGDLIIVTIHIDNNVGTISSSGFTLIRNSHGTSATVATFYKIATNSEPNSYTFNTSGGASSNDKIYSSRVTGHNPSNPIGNSNGLSGVVTQINGGDEWAITVNSVTAANNNSMLVAALAVGYQPYYGNSPSGMSAVYYDDSQTETRVSIQTLISSGATGTRAFTWPRYWKNPYSFRAAAQMFVINPAPLDVDAAYYLLNGTPVLLGNTNGASGTENVTVNSNDEIGFRVSTSNNTGGPGKLTIYNLYVPNDVPVATGITDTIVPNCQVVGYTPVFIPPTVTDDCGVTIIKPGFPQTDAVSTNDCENSQTRSWVYVDECGAETDTFRQTFTWTTINDIILTCPNDTSLVACISSAEIQAAYNIWKAGFSSTGGCGLVTTNINSFPLLPDLTCGGELEFKYIVSDDCGQIDSCTSDFTVETSTDLVVTAPKDTTLSACSSTAEIQAAYNIWHDGFTKTGGCASVTTNIASIPALGDLTCGGQLSFTLVADYSTTGCVYSVDTSSTFTVETPDLLVVNVPDGVSLPLCSDSTTIKNAYDNWVAGFILPSGCDVTTNIASIPPLGDLLCGGELSFTFTADNGSGYCIAHAEDSSTFTITDAPDLTVTCPTDPNIAGCSGAIAVTAAYNNWVDGFTASGGCDVTTNIDEVPLLGDMVCNGQLTFTYIAINGSGVCADTAECTQTFTIGTPDVLAVSCPSDTTVEGCTAADVQVAFNAWIALFGYTGGCNATATDLSFYSPPATCGSALTVNYVASDECGDADSCSATFSVVAPTLTATAPSDNVQPACQVQADVDVAFNTWIAQFGYAGGCAVSETNLSSFTAPDVCGGTVVISYTATGACGQVENRSAFFTIDEPNNVLQEPTFTVPADITISKDADCNYDADPTITGVPTNLTDNCTNIDSLTVTFTDSIVDGGCEGEILIYRKWTVTDNCSNVTNETQIITVADNTLAPVITCPADVSENADPSNCFKTGLVLGTATATDNCTPDAMINITNDAPDPFPVGTTVVTWTATDDCGNISTCTQNVTIIDITPPNITIGCADATEYALANNCDKIPATLNDPVYNDDCWPVDSLTLTWTMTGATTGSGTGSVADSTFNVGVTTVEYTVTDPDGNSTTCDFTVTIVHIEIPQASFTCPQDTVYATPDAGNCDAVVPLGALTYVDPCNEIDSVWNESPHRTSYSDASGTYPVGITDFTWYITDISGNIDSCLVTVIVADLLPTLVCPSDIITQADFEETFASGVVVLPPTFEDNCPDSTLTWEMTGVTTGNGDAGAGIVSIVPSPNTFNVGVTTITYTFTDTNGNIVTCSFTITVESKPVIDCPPDTTVYAGAANCINTFDPGIPKLLEGAAPLDWTWGMTGATTGSGSTSGASGLPNIIGNTNFNLGTTTITWTATNVSGADTCFHLVIVEDTIPPTFTTSPFEDCVDLLHWATYDPANVNPFINHINPNMNKWPSPDFRTFFAGSTELDLLTLEDNCCDSVDMTINWRIEFTDTPNPLTLAPDISYTSISATGQPSIYGSDILLPGDGVYFNPITHIIKYWVEDCNGNVSDTLTNNIVITPRPEVIKQNY